MNTYLKKLEYDIILQQLSNHAITYLGKEKCLSLRPSNKKEYVQEVLKETYEATTLLYKCNTPPLSEIADNSINIKTIESYGTLSIKSILDLNNILIISENLKKYFNADYINKDDFKLLTNIFNNLYSNNSITEKISKSIIDENTIDDNASKELSQIRKKYNAIEQDIKSKLNNFIHSSTYSKYIQENVITIRNNRYVIPVKAEYRNQIKGFVHDVSSTGSTIFIEPIAIFELNNEISNLKVKENIEIEKILQDLSKLFFPCINEIKDNINYISKLDFIFAKAKYSKSLNCITPIINDNKYISLINARHPLINQSTVIPITLSLGKDFSTLVITGPNTGGKTVTLKTIGLLTAMACSGLNIPASENSSIYVFDNIFADIGDDQSISNSLSTFSSHIKNIVDIVKNSTENSLILVDELGSGTDPLEGAALAISILNHFKENKSLTIATTHYQELKKYAIISEDVENASVEFNINTLSPTYHLLVGVPGKSNAFEISNKLGLPDIIIKNAKSNLTTIDINFENILKNIYDNKAKIEEEKLEISKELNKISNLRKSLEKDNSNLLKEEKQIIDNAKYEARSILLNAKDTANKIISEMNNLKSSRESNNELNNLRKKLNKNIKEINIEQTTPDASINSLKPEEIQLNKEVYVSTFEKNGIILSKISKSNEVLVQIGNIKTTINIKYLEKAKNTFKNNSTSSYSNITKTQNAKSEINVIGLNIDEAVFIVDKFLDDSYLAKLSTIRIIHGKGTGKLREGIHKFLKTNAHVKSFRIGTFGEGEMGVTIVELLK